MVTVRHVSAKEALHLPIEQRVRAAITLFDAQVSPLGRGWDLESVLDTAWTVEFQSDGACTAELLAEVQGSQRGSSVELPGETDAGREPVHLRLA